MDFFKEKHFKINQFVYSQGETPKYIFIVLNGLFELHRKSVKTKEVGNNDSHTKNFLGNAQQNSCKMDSSFKKFSLEKSRCFQNIRLSSCCYGQIVGLEDALKNRAYTHSMKCVSAVGSVYRIKLEDFNVKMQRDEKTWQLIHSIADQKDVSTIDKIKQAYRNKKVGVE